MSIALALLCALTYGSGDFFGGVAARKVPPIAIAWLAHSMVVVPIAVAATFVGPTTPSPHDVVWGAFSGLLGAIGLLLLYFALGRGPMTIVAPTTALIAASLPVAAGTLLGERPSQPQWIGIIGALIAIVVISGGASQTEDSDLSRELAERSKHPRPTIDRTTLLATVGAGLGFGAFFVALDYTSDESGLWPLVAGRIASALVVTILVISNRRIRALALAPNLRSAVPAIAASAALDVTANVFFLFAVRGGLLSIVSVISSLYPASTILLANRILREHISRKQFGGMVLAVGAIGLVAAG